MNRWLRNTILLTIFFTLSVVQLFSQEFRMLHYNVDDGLPSNTVYHAFKDSKGFLWIGTDKGIVRYNGIRFETFTTSNGMPDNEIFFFQEDKEGRIWLATFNGELCYYKNAQFHTAKNTPFLKLPFKNTFINNMVVEADSSITIMFGNKKKMISVKGETIRILKDNKDEEISHFIYIHKLKDGTFKYIYNDKTKILDNNNNFSSVLPPPVNIKEWGLSISQGISNIYDKNTVYTTDLKPIKKYDSNAYKSHVNSLYIDNFNRLMMCTDKGVWLEDGKTFLNNHKITSITQDALKNYWIATYTDGIYVVDYNYYHAAVYNNCYTGNIRYTYADNDNLFYVTSENNLYLFKNGTTQLLFDYSKLDNSKKDVSSNHGYLIIKNLNGTYDYINYYKNFRIYLSDITGSKKTYISKVPFIAAENVKSIIDVGSFIYLRTIKSLYKIDINSYKNTNAIKDSCIHIVKDTERIYAFGKAYDNALWYSTVNGVYKVKNDVCTVERQFHDAAFKKFEFLKNYLVGYTHTKPIICRNFDRQNIMDSNLRQGSVWDRIYPIDSTHLLISTNELYRLFSIAKNSTYPYYTVTAVENSFVPLRSELIAADQNNCYFFVGGSITKMTIDNLLKPSLTPKLFFSTIKYGDKKYVPKNNMLIPYKLSKDITIAFTTLSFTGKNIRYEYSFSQNAEDKWLPLLGEEINLVSPQHGNYKLKIRARSISSKYSDPIILNFTILPPFWATWWFIAITVIISLALIIVAVRYRIAMVLKKNQKENENKIRFLKSEYKALNALMNPHFIFNTLNNVQGLVNRNDKLAANEYLRIFADLVRQNMHNVSKEMISLQKEIDLVSNYLKLEKLRFKEMLNYEIDVDDEVDTAVIMVPPLFIQPLVENSIKHGILPKQSDNSTIRIHIYEVNDILHIEVRDNGVGLNFADKKRDPKHESFGLSNIKNRIEQLSIILNKKVNFELKEEKTNSGQWTVVSITMEL